MDSSYGAHSDRQAGFLARCILILLTVSFVAQPTSIRPLGIPLAMALVILFNVVWLATEFRAKTVSFILFVSFPAALVLSDLLSGVGWRGSILALLLIFTALGGAVHLRSKDLLILWRTLVWVCFLLAVVGLFRYLNGYIAPLSENVGGLGSVVESYFYLGISYLPATRNSDALYFVIGLLASVRLSLTESNSRSIYFILTLFFAAIVALSLARWAYLASITGVLIMLRPEQRIKGLTYAGVFSLAGVLIVASVYGIKNGPLGFIYSLVENALRSIFSVSSANQNVSGYYTYSNNERSELYLATIKNFFSWPLGQGMDSPFFENANQKTTKLHSENLFLDFLIVFGVFASFLFFIAAKKVARVLRRYRKSEHARFSAGVLSVCTIFAMLNSPVNLVIFWFFLVVGLIEGNKSVRH